MNCDDVSEFLPWLLNGTLESKERDEVRRHLATCERCRAALAETREAWTTFDQHLPAEALVALAYGETPSGIDAAVAERHLASCPQCAAELELARMSRRLEEDDKVAVFPAAPTARPRNEAAERAASRSWRAAALAAGFAAVVGGSLGFYEFQQAGDLAAQLSRKPAARESPPAAPAPSPAAGNPALAAQLAELERQTAAFKERTEQQLRQDTQRIAELSRRAQPSSEPQVNAWSGLVNPAYAERGAGAAPEEKVVPAGRLSVLSLGTESEGTAVREVEIRDAGGTVVWTSPGLRSDAKSQQFSFGLPAGFLKPGRYTIQLYETVNGQRVPRESYTIRVE
jgi:anti-sigma factor RsiW